MMDPKDDMERLRRSCEECLKALEAMKTHEGICVEWMRWRFAHLRREMLAFVTVMWPKKQEEA